MKSCLEETRLTSFFRRLNSSVKSITVKSKKECLVSVETQLEGGTVTPFWHVLSHPHSRLALFFFIKFPNYIVIYFVVTFFSLCSLFFLPRLDPGFINFMAKCLNFRRKVRTIFTDLAFNIVNHKTLLSRLISRSISTSLVT